MLLDGLRVLDLSRVLAGPYCAMLMGDLGADVIKLERPPRGDDLREYQGKHGISAVFAAVNRNKRGIAIDLQQAGGARLAFQLARRADVIIENFLPGVAGKLGLGYEAVKTVNPSVVYASVTGFGQDGPYAKRPGYNTIAQGMSGIMALTGMPGHPPTRVAGSTADVAGSLVCFGAVNAALVHRFRTGQGQHLDVNLLASTLGLLPDPAAHYFTTGVRPERHGNRNPVLTPAEAFKTKDGWITIVLMNPEQWGRFCGVLGDDELATHPKFATNPDRLAHHAELKARVEAAFATATTAEWVERFEAAQIAAGPIYEFDEVFEDPQVQHLGLIAQMNQPAIGPMRMLGFPFRATSPATIRRPAPLLGQHTREVLDELGVSPGEMERLSAAGVVLLGDSPGS